MSAPRIAILLPPSEGKADGGRRRPWDPSSGAFGPALATQRAAVAEALVAAGGGDEKLLDARGPLLERARAANITLLGAPSMRAGARYTGVVWEAMSLGTAPEPVRRRASTSVAVVSALHGLVGLDDPIPDYRLKMGASLPPLGKLSTWWRGPLSGVIAEWTKGRFVVDLLTNDLRAAWDPPSRGRGVRVQFVERGASRAGGVVGHDAKAAKGRLARHLLESTVDPHDALEAWDDARFALVLTPLS